MYPEQLMLSIEATGEVLSNREFITPSFLPFSYRPSELAECRSSAEPDGQH
jgi:hypothetical protein